MKAIVNGKRYDTETARQVAVWESRHYRSDFHWHSEELYRTPRGAWFIYGEGNGLSPWSRRHVDGMGYGCAIRPIGSKEALAWLEDHGFTAEAEAEFGDKIEDA